MKVAVNNCCGGFGLSHKAMMRLAELKKIDLKVYMIDYDKSEGYPHQMIPCDDPSKFDHTPSLYYSTKDVKLITDLDENIQYDFCNDRSDPLLIQVIEELGDEASDYLSRIVILEIPDGIYFYIVEDEEGYESIHEKHRTWYPSN